MGFTANTVRQIQEEREVKGKRKKVAVDCWFTSTGRAIPHIVKYEDEEGCLQTIRDIQVLKREQKNFAGIYSQRFDCQAVVEGYERQFILMFRLQDHTWDMIIRE